MDVRCSRCGIEYEFDDAKVTSRGVTVKCTSCGHVFKVKRDDPSVPAPVDLSDGDPMKGDGEWIVRQAGGNAFRFRELTTLQKWIVEQKVGRTDEISRSGRTWKALGDISELASFFQVVDAANAAARVPATQPPTSQPHVPMPATSLPPTSARMPSPATTRIPQAAAPDAGPTTVPVARAPAQPAPLDADDPVLQWQARRRRTTIAAAVGAVLVVGGLGAWMFVNGRGAGASAATAQAAAEVARARAALVADDAAGTTAALAALEPALSSSSRSPEVLAGAARLHVARAAHLGERARLATVLGKLDAGAAPVLQASAMSAVRDRDAELVSAYRLVGEARGKAPDATDVLLAGAAYQGEKRAIDEMQADLAPLLASGDPAVRTEAQVVGALAVVARALDVASAAELAAAQRSIDEAGQPQDARLRYARASLAVAKAMPGAGGALDDAASQLGALGRSDDERIALLRRIVTVLGGPMPGGAPPVATATPPVATATTTDAGPTIATATTTPEAPTPASPSATTPPMTTTPPTTTPPTATPPAAPPPPAGPAESYEAVLARAEKTLRSDRSSAALALYQKAAGMEPTAASPWIGVGWSQLDLGRPQKAIEAFRKALALEPIPDARFGLAEALRAAGNKAEARAAYQAFLDVAPSGPDAVVARNALEQLSE